MTTNSILNSNISAGGEVNVCGEKGVIIGGYTHGFRSIKSANAGNDAERKTILHVGYEAGLYESYLDMKKREAVIKHNLSAIVSQITSQMHSQKFINLKKKYGTDDETENTDEDKTAEANDELDISKKIAEWTKQKNELFNEIEQIRPVRERLEEKIMLADKAKIEISGHIYIGTMIAINDRKYLVNKNTSFMIYSIKSGIIEAKVMVL